MLNISFLLRAGDYTPDADWDRNVFLVSTAYAGHGAGQLRAFDPKAGTAAPKTPIFDRMIRMIAAVTRPAPRRAEGLSDEQRQNLNMLVHRLHL